MVDLEGLSIQQKHLGNYREKKTTTFLRPVQGWTFLENSKHLAMDALLVRLKLRKDTPLSLPLPPPAVGIPPAPPSPPPREG